MRMGIIGAGVMGEAIISGVLGRGEMMPGQIVASEPRAERRQVLHERYGIMMVTDNRVVVELADIVILAVKPQVVAPVVAYIRGKLRPESLCLSVIAGVPSAALVHGLQHEAVVRAIPNTPAQVSAGMTVWTATDVVTDQQRTWARMILGSLGHELYVADEGLLDRATALSGSGPAYIFLLLEAMIDAGVHLGFSRHDAELLVFQTVLGSVEYAATSNLHLAQLRNGVTSPGGTTAAGLAELERAGVRTALSDAIWAAYHRAEELGLAATRAMADEELDSERTA